MTHRLRWEDLPLPVCTRVETLLGAPVLETRSATGGFSSSSAEIVTTAGGSRAFVKAVTSRINAASEELNRREAATLAALPREVPAPQLLDAFSEGDWFVMLIEAADGALPQQPWQPRELDVVLEALETLAQVATDMLAGILGFFVDAARLPTDPSLPTLRQHRRATRDQLFPMVRDRWIREGRD